MRMRGLCAIGRFLDWYEANEGWPRGVVTIAFLVGLWAFCLGVNALFYLLGCLPDAFE